MKKSGKLYIVILISWFIASIVLLLATVFLIRGLKTMDSVNYKVLVGILISINSIILAFLWLGSIKDLAFCIAFLVNKKKFMKEYSYVLNNKKIDTSKKVVLTYCTCNDFNKKALKKCMNQHYKNFETVILDDSSKEKYIKEIDKFASKYNVRVIRRTDHSGFKAGNLNNYLMNNLDDYDYFVVLDSDEVIPSNYITKALRYFASYPNCGALQARHISYDEENYYQKIMGMSVRSNGLICQVVKNFYGSNALIGHGMMISKECYLATGGFPHVVAEDISMAVEIKNHGYEIIYAYEICCKEQFPVSYLSLKKRQCKWTQGNLEYMQKYNNQITSSKMTWFEKLDLILSHYTLPLTPVLSILMVIISLILGTLGYPSIKYSFFLYGLMMLFLCAPLIPEIFVKDYKKPFLYLIPYFLINIITYASLEAIMLKTVVFGLFGQKAKFIVTPKENEKCTLKEALLGTMDSLIFGTIIGVLCYLACGSIIPVLFILIGSLCAPLVCLLSNITISKKKDLFASFN